MKKITLMVLTVVIAVATMTAGERTVKARSLDGKQRKSGQQVDMPCSIETVKSLLPHGKQQRASVLKAFKETRLELMRVAVFEDFSNFTAGSEAVPDGVEISDIETGDIAESYTRFPGWNGAGVYQAGGKAYLGMVEYDDGSSETGWITTPLADLSSADGQYTVKFKARSVSEDGDLLCVVGIGMSAEMVDYSDIVITNEWDEYTVSLTGGDMLSSVQWYSYEFPIYIDDIAISQVDDGTLGTPVALPATDLTKTGFTANWMEARNAAGYLLSVYSYGEPTGSTEEQTVTEGFDGIKTIDTKLIDTSDPNYPAGWEISVIGGKDDKRHVYQSDGNYSSAPQSLAFADDGDYLTTPLVSGTMTKFSFWLKGQNAVNSFVVATAYDGVAWSEFARIDAGKYNTSNAGTVDLSDKLPQGTIQVKLSYAKSTSNCSIDDVSYTYSEEARAVDYLLQDFAVAGTSHAVAGTEAGVQYYYKVKATNGTETSAYSNEIKVEEGDEPPVDTPTMLTPTNVSDAGFTAHWEAVDEEAVYLFYTYLFHTAQAGELYTVDHEDFNRFSTAEVIETPYIDEYMVRPDWYLLGGVIDTGMLGLDGSTYLQSPTFALSGSEKIVVEVTVQGAEGDVLYVGNVYGEGDEDYIQKEIQLQTGKHTYTVDFETNSTGTAYVGNSFIFLAYLADEAQPCYIDDLKIGQQLKAGETVSTPYFYTELLSGETSVEVSTLDKQPGDQYAYTAAAIHVDWETGEILAATDYAELMFVQAGGTSINTPQQNVGVYVNGDLHVALEAPQTIAVYTLSGVLVAHVQGVSGDNAIALPSPGTYIVKVGETVAKVVK